MSSSDGVYKCKLLKQDVSKGQLHWIQRKEQAKFTISPESLILRDISSGYLLADFPRTSITAFRLVKKDVLSVEDVDRVCKLAIRFDPSQLGELVKELHRKSFPKISNQICEALETSSSILGKRKHGPIELPDLTNVLVQENVLELLFNPRFGDFVQHLHHIVDGFRGKLLEPYDHSEPQSLPAISSMTTNTDLASIATLSEPQAAAATPDSSKVSNTVQEDISAAWDDDQFFEDV